MPRKKRGAHSRKPLFQPFSVPQRWGDSSPPRRSAPDPADHLSPPRSHVETHPREIYHVHHTYQIPQEKPPFSKPPMLLHSKAGDVYEDPGCFIVQSSFQRASSLISIGDTNSCVRILNAHTLEEHARVDVSRYGPIHQLSFSQQHGKETLFGTCGNGGVQLWDCRSVESPAMSFEVGDDHPVLCFALSSSQLAAGSGGRVFIWDVVAAKPYLFLEEAHADLVTKLHYYPTAEGTQLVSGSEDGMVNVFDAMEADADMVLLSTTPVGRAVEDFGFYGMDNSKLWVLTTDEDLSLWHMETCEEIFRSSDFRRHVNTTRPPDYCVGVSTALGSDPLVALMGYNGGDIHMYSLAEDGRTRELSNLPSHTGKVRTWINDLENDVHYTGGEDGLLCRWSQLPTTSAPLRDDKP